MLSLDLRAHHQTTAVVSGRELCKRALFLAWKRRERQSSRGNVLEAKWHARLLLNKLPFR
jgi:hypothetical protein